MEIDDEDKIEGEFDKLQELIPELIARATVTVEPPKPEYEERNKLRNGRVYSPTFVQSFEVPSYFLCFVIAWLMSSPLIISMPWLRSVLRRLLAYCKHIFRRMNMDAHLQSQELSLLIRL
jgi:hypothetical protein